MTRKQLKNKLTHPIKKPLKIFQSLMKNTNEIGWDHNLGNCDASDQWQDKQIHVNFLYMFY